VQVGSENCTDPCFIFVRRESELAGAKGVTPNQIALAYVLCESPQVFALIGPENIEELRQCLEGLKLRLSPTERRWLNLESKSL